MSRRPFIQGLLTFNRGTALEFPCEWSMGRPVALTGDTGRRIEKNGWFFGCGV